MSASRSARAAAVAISTLLAAAACGGGGGPSGSGTPGGGQTGGTYRVGWENAFAFTNNFDPTGEYLGDAFSIYSSLLIRTLAGYNHVAGQAGNKLVPDLATSLPRPADAGRTYTFHLRPHVRFGPPVNRAITSKDILYAFERLAIPKNGGQYAFYYQVIKGFTAYGQGHANTISGIETPNPSTIVFHLTQPTGDFLYRLSMPATGPIPEEVAKCFDGQPGRYGRDLVSSGPYMIAGSDQVDDSSCSTLKPMSGFDGQTKLDLVRNPNYDPHTDSPAARQNLPDEFIWTVDSSADDILAKVEAGQLDDEVSSIPPQVLRTYSTSTDKRRYFHQNSGDRTWFLAMNLTQPPFDDIHVRRAMNWVMDKAALVQAWGGPTIGKVANHIVPDGLFRNQLSEYAPYKTPGDHGSVTKARAAMKGSKYDTRGNGMCDTSACHGALLVADTRQIDTKMVPVIEADARKIGITFTTRTINGAYPTMQTPSKNIALMERPGWGKDYADPLTFFDANFDGRTIIPTGNSNYSLVGITPGQCQTLHIDGNCDGVPNVNADLDRCSHLLDDPRLTCYENLDKKLMTDVVPWVPYLWQLTTHITSSNVTHWSFDQFGTSIGYAHVAVK